MISRSALRVSYLLRASAVRLARHQFTLCTIGEQVHVTVRPDASSRTLEFKPLLQEFGFDDFILHSNGNLEILYRPFARRAA